MYTDLVRAALELQRARKNLYRRDGVDREYRAAKIAESIDRATELVETVLWQLTPKTKLLKPISA